ncbi:MAG: ATP-binding protein [Planctomycetota bacterium]
MSLHPVLTERLNEALAPTSVSLGTPRDARLPDVPGKVHAVIGMRRAGKTTFLRQHQEHVRREVGPERAPYLSFDDDRLAGIGVDQLSLLLEEYYRRYPGLRQQQPVHLYLDEIQFVPDWERFVRRTMDSEAVRFVVSGSSARMLSREVHTSLRGRGLATVIRPFGFREYLRHRGEEPDRPPGHWTAADRSRIENRFLAYLDEGGFPEVQGQPVRLRFEVLQGYVDTVLFRDVVERYRVTQVAALRWIVRHGLRNPAGSLSVHRLHQDLRSQGLGIGKDAVHELFGHLLDAFLLSSVHLATESERRRNSNPRKVYPADPGLVHAFDSSGRSNVGHTLEVAVLNEIERRGTEVGYVKTRGGREVDFLLRSPGEDPELIQVCADARDPETARRELAALREAGAEHPHATQRLLTLNRDGFPPGDTGSVVTQSVCEWLLEGGTA